MRAHSGRLVWPGLLLAVILGATACQAQHTTKPAVGTAGVPTAAASSTQSSPAVGSKASPSATAASSPTRSASAGPATRIDPSVGLSALDSYHQHFEVAIQGTVSGSPVVSTQKLDRWANGGDQALLVDGASGDQPPLHMRTVGLGGYAYVQWKDGGPCNAFAATSAGQAPGDPQLPSVSGAREAGSETLNSVKVKRYDFDETGVRAVAGANGKAQGTMWVAESGGYQVKYELTVQLNEKDVQGKRTWSYELSDVGLGKPVDLPKGCLAVPADFPVMTDAARVDREPAFVAYATKAIVVDTAAFYRQQLPGLGWAALPGVEPDAKGASLTFSRARKDGTGELAVVTIQPSQVQTQVVAQIVATKQQIKSTVGKAATPSVQPTAVQTPAATAASLPSDLPMYPGAKVTLKNQQTIVQTTGDATTKVLAYYQTELKKAGWSLGDQIESGPTVSQSWSRNGIGVQLVVMRIGAQTQVVLNAQEAE